MNLRREFIELALQDGSNRRELCRRYGISAKTGYALLKRYQEENWGSLQERSRRPSTSPLQTAAALEAKVVELRRQHPAWGGRKLHRRLCDLGIADVPGAQHHYPYLARPLIQKG